MIPRPPSHHAARLADVASLVLIVLAGALAVGILVTGICSLVLSLAAVVWP